MTRPWTFVWMNTIPAAAWHGDPVSCWTQIVAAYLKAASASHVRVSGEPAVQVGEDPGLPAGLLKVAVSSKAYPMAAEAEKHAVCEDCGATSLSGGRWCLRCFQTHHTDKRSSPSLSVICGSSAGYHRHSRAGERPCDDCKAARTAHRRARAVG